MSTDKNSIASFSFDGDENGDMACYKIGSKYFFQQFSLVG